MIARLSKVFSPSPRLAGGLLGWAASVGPALAMLALCWDRTVNHDTAWYLIATRKWLAGAELYTGIVEINPPLAFYLTAPSLGLADATGLTLARAFYVTVAALLCIALRLSWLLLRGLGLGRGASVAFLALTTAMIVLIGIDDTGQRDQLLMLFALPWLLGQLLPPERQTSYGALFRAAFAAIGICLKPYFILLPAFITVWHMIRERSWRPAFSRSNWTFLTAGLLYATFVRMVHPAYFTSIVPLGRQVYGAYSFGWPAIQEQLLQPSTMLAVLIGAWASRKSAEAGMFLAAALAGLVSFLLQWTGFHYQTIPYASCCAIGLTFVLVSDRYGTAWRAAAAAILGIVAAAGAAGAHNRNPIAEDLAKRIGNRGSFAMFSTDLYPGPPTALESKAVWASRYPALWLVPGAVNRLAQMDCVQQPGPCRALTSILDATRGDIIADLDHDDPQILIFDEKSPFFRMGPIDWMRFMSVHPEFHRIMERYRCEQQTDRFQIWARIRQGRDDASWASVRSDTYGCGRE